MVKVEQLRKITAETIMKQRNSRNDKVRLKVKGAIELIVGHFTMNAPAVAETGRDYFVVYTATSLSEICKKSVNFNSESRLSKANALKKFLSQLEANDRTDDYITAQLEQVLMCIELMNEFDSHGFVTEFIYIHDEINGEMINVHVSWSEKYK